MYVYLQTFTTCGTKWDLVFSWCWLLYIRDYKISPLVFLIIMLNLFIFSFISVFLSLSGSWHAHELYQCCITINRYCTSSWDTVIWMKDAHPAHQPLSLLGSAISVLWRGPVKSFTGGSFKTVVYEESVFVFWVFLLLFFSCIIPSLR